MAYIARTAVAGRAEAIAAATDSESTGCPCPAGGPRAQLRVAKVKVQPRRWGSDRGVTVLESPGGASASSRQRNLDRHWRNVRPPLQIPSA